MEEMIKYKSWEEFCKAYTKTDTSTSSQTVSKSQKPKEPKPVKEDVPKFMTSGYVKSDKRKSYPVQPLYQSSTPLAPWTKPCSPPRTESRSLLEDPFDIDSILPKVKTPPTLASMKYYSFKEALRATALMPRKGVLPVQKMTKEERILDFFRQIQESPPETLVNSWLQRPVEIHCSKESIRDTFDKIMSSPEKEPGKLPSGPSADQGIFIRDKHSEALGGERSPWKTAMDTEPALTPVETLIQKSHKKRNCEYLRDLLEAPVSITPEERHQFNIATERGSMEPPMSMMWQLKKSASESSSHHRRKSSHREHGHKKGASSDNSTTMKQDGSSTKDSHKRRKHEHRSETWRTPLNTTYEEQGEHHSTKEKKKKRKHSKSRSHKSASRSSSHHRETSCREPHCRDKEVKKSWDHVETFIEKSHGTRKCNYLDELLRAPVSLPLQERNSWHGEHKLHTSITGGYWDKPRA